MKDFSVKKVVLGVIAALAALMALLALCFSLTVEMLDWLPVSIYSDCGFTMLDFSTILIDESYQWGANVMGLLCYVQLLGSLALLVLNVVGIFCFSRKASFAISLGGTIGALIFTFLYMLEGIIYTVIVTLNSSSIEYITYAYLPFVFTLLIAIAYFVCKFAIKESQAAEENGININTAGFAAAEPGNPISSDKADIAVMNFRSFIPEGSVLTFRNALTHASDEQFTRLCIAPVKNPMTVLLFSIFLGGLGVDRFYIGDTGLGIAKLLVGWLTFGIWPIIDIFFCYKKAKENNLQMLLNCLKYKNCP